MKVFLSWSGDRSKQVANYLKEWLQLVLQSVKPWASDGDIGRGEQWFNAINKGIEESTTGIICLTKENKNKPWILFEAGALFKGVDKKLLMTLLIDLDANDLIGSPLYHFNHTTLDSGTMLKLIEGINALLPEPRDANILKRSFDMFWGEFEVKIKEIIEATRSSEDIIVPVPIDKQTIMMETILQTVTNIDRSLNEESKSKKYFDSLQIQLFEQKHMADKAREEMRRDALVEMEAQKMVTDLLANRNVITAVIQQYLFAKGYELKDANVYQQEITDYMAKKFPRGVDPYLIGAILKDLSNPKQI